MKSNSKLPESCLKDFKMVLKRVNRPYCHLMSRRSRIVPSVFHLYLLKVLKLKKGFISVPARYVPLLLDSRLHITIFDFKHF